MLKTGAHDRKVNNFTRDFTEEANIFAGIGYQIRHSGESIHRIKHNGNRLRVSLQKRSRSSSNSKAPFGIVGKNYLTVRKNADKKSAVAKIR